MSHTALDNWQAPLPADKPEWQSTLEGQETALKALRDKVMHDYQLASKDADPIAGLAQDALGGLADTLSDAITDLSNDSENLAHEAAGE